MEIKTQKDGDRLTVTLSGRLDGVTAPQLEQELIRSIVRITELVFDLADLDYVSSAGLRVILGAQKKMASLGSMRVRNVNPPVMEVFDMTGFTGMLTIE